MPAILKNKHLQFCDSIHDIRCKYNSTDDELVKLEDELNKVYKNYQEQIDDLKSIIAEYNKKQQQIRNKVKILIRKKIPTASLLITLLNFSSLDIFSGL